MKLDFYFFTIFFQETLILDFILQENVFDW